MEQNLKGVSQMNEKEFYDTIMRLWTNNINKNVEAKDLKFSIKLLVDKGFSFVSYVRIRFIPGIIPFSQYNFIF